MGQPYAEGIGYDVNASEWVAIVVVASFDTEPDAVWFAAGGNSGVTYFLTAILPLQQPMMIFYLHSQKKFLRAILIFDPNRRMNMRIDGVDKVNAIIFF